MIPPSPASFQLSASKPRACGDDPDIIIDNSNGGQVNPARAGMILTGVIVTGVIVCKPRACGDDPSADGTCEYGEM